MSPLLLAPEIQVRIAMGDLALTDRALRRVVAEPRWREQVAVIADRDKETK